MEAMAKIAAGKPFSYVSGILSQRISIGAILGWTGVSLAILLMAAHFFRAGDYALAANMAIIAILHCGKAQWKYFAVGAFLL